MDLFQRSFRLEFGDIALESLAGEISLRVAFSVESDTKPEPNNAEIAIWNLARATREKLSKTGALTARLSAGYGGDVHQIFYGVLDVVEHIKQGPDWITRISAGDGRKEITGKRVSLSFKKGTLVRDVLREMVAHLGLGQGNLSSLNAEPEMAAPLRKGLTVHGNLADEITAFARARGFVWSVQGGTVQFAKEGSTVPGTRAVLLSPGTGLIGTPQFDAPSKDYPKGSLQCQCLIQPGIIPNFPVVIESESFSGQFRVVETQCHGDTHGTEWFYDIRAVPT